MITLAHFQEELIRRHKPFVTFRLPGEQTPTTGVGRNGFETVNNLKAMPRSVPAFLISSFFADYPAYWMALKTTATGSEVSRSLLDDLPNQNLINSTDVPAIIERETYMEQVDQAIRLIRTGQADKIVISRPVVMELPDAREKAPLLFQQLMNFGHAFVYLANTPGGLWLGASPEKLLAFADGTLSTMALAGTRKAGAAGEWGAKEIREQQWVSDYVRDRLQAISGAPLTVSPSETAIAGNVEHIRTLFSMQAGYDQALEVLGALHPTPAVSGFPKEKAIQWVRHIETYDRSFYAGFLGPVNNHGFQLFVNLRCARVLPDKLIVYVGAGITGNSDAAREWDETEAKSRLILDIAEKLA